MTYEESNALTNDPAFRGRVKIACLKFASSIAVEASDVPAHNVRLRWASQTFQSPDQVAMQTTPPVVLDPAIQADGDAVTDPALQSAVESTVTKMF